MVSEAAARVARLRVPIGFVCGAIVWWLAKPSVHTLVAGGVVACAGEALRIWAAGHLVKSREVTASGPYRWFAHPLYVGSSIMGVGLAIGANSLPTAVVISVYLGVTISAAIKSEEAFLRRTFGDEYDAWRRGRRAVDPASGRRFTLERVLSNREQRAIGGLAAAMGLLALKLVLTGLGAANI